MFRLFTIDQALKIFVICMIVAPLADIAALIAFFMHKAGFGYEFLEFGNGSIAWDFLTTPIGAILTTLGIIPYGIAILGLRLARQRNSNEFR